MSKLFSSTLPRRSYELLEDLMTNKALNNFYLVGGTALSLQIGHRISVDLDLLNWEASFEIVRNKINNHIKSLINISE